MKIDCVVILGPSGEFHPLVTEDAPKFTLPFMNIPLINLTLNYLSPFASKIFIACLEKHVKKVREHLNHDVPVEFITTVSYEGMGHILNLVRRRIKTSHFVLCKGEVYGLEPLNSLIESFAKSDDDLYISIVKSDKDSPPMCIDSMNYLRMYNSYDIPLLKNQRCLMTIEYSIKDFYIVKTGSFDMLDGSLYCFKNNILPFLIQNKLKIRICENMVLQIKNMSDYISQLDLKNHLLGSSESYAYNLLDPECRLHSNVEVEDSIIGAKAIISDGSTIRRSIIMEDAIIEEDCLLDSCIVGRGSVIHFRSKLRDCKVADGHIFKHSVKASSIMFTNE